MKKIYLFLMGFLMIGLVSAIIDPLVYDDFQDGFFNETLWYNHTFGDGVGGSGMTAQMREEIGNLYLRVAQSGGGGAGPNDFMNVSVNTTKFMSVNDLMLFVRNVTTKVTKGADGSKVFGYVNMFGQKVNPTGADTSIFAVHYNDSSKGLYYTNDNAFQSVFNATNNEVKYTVELKEGTSSTSIDMYVYDLNYTLRRTVAVNLTSPINNSNLINSTLHFISNLSTPSIEEDAYSLANATLYIWDSENNIISTTTNVVSGSSNLSEYDIDPLPAGYYTWNVLACTIDDNSQTNCDYSESNRSFFFYGLIINSETYNSITNEGTTETFKINITFHESISAIEGVLYYNGTPYSSTRIGTGNTLELESTIAIPIVSATLNNSFYWEISLINSSSTTKFNSSTQTQQVNNVNIDDCTAYSVEIFNFSLKDEQSQNLINANSYNTSVEIELNIFSLGSSNALINFSQNYSENNNPRICFQNSLGNSTYTMNLQARYLGDGYASEFYNLHNSSLTNTTLGQNIDLFDLKSDVAESFKITFKDDNFLPVSGAIIQIQRRYISEGVSKTVEAPMTDENGETHASLQLNDVIYTLIVSKNGAVLGTFNDVIAICQNPDINDCVINLNTFSSGIGPEDYTVGNDFSFTITHINRTISAIYSIPSGSVSAVGLNVTLIDGLGTNLACADSLSSSSGTLSCTIPQNLGNGTVIATLYKDGVQVGIAYIILRGEPEDLYGANLIFLGLFLIVSLVGIGIGSNPMISGIFVIIGAVLLVLFNLIDTGNGAFIGAGATILWLIVAVIIILIKGAKRQ